MIETYLEATNLKKDTNWKDIRTFVQNAEEQKCYGVCSWLYWSVMLSKYAKNCKKICVIGFPTGSPVQILKDLQVLSSVIDEYDVVVPLWTIKQKRFKDFRLIMDEVRKQTKGKILKAIIETTLLEEKEFKPVIKICEFTGVNYIKTNTGVYQRKRPIEKDIELIKQITQLPIKASGGISTYEQAKKLVDMGVSRIGTSNPNNILIGEKELQ